MVLSVQETSRAVTGEGMWGEGADGLGLSQANTGVTLGDFGRSGDSFAL